MCSNYPANTSVKVLSGASESAWSSAGVAGNTGRNWEVTAAPRLPLWVPLSPPPPRDGPTKMRGPTLEGKQTPLTFSATQPLSGKVTVLGSPQSWAPASSSLLCSCWGGGGGARNGSGHVRSSPEKPDVGLNEATEPAPSTAAARAPSAQPRGPSCATSGSVLPSVCLGRDPHAREPEGRVTE